MTQEKTVSFYRETGPGQSIPVIDGDNDIVLSTLNAKYIHASLGLRYLYANMGELKNATVVKEFTINTRVIDIAEQLLVLQPKVIGFGVYIWNIRETTELVSLIGRLAPEIKIVIGGPEVSFEYQNTLLYALCDHLITGQADLAFRTLCIHLLGNTKPPKVIDAATPLIQHLEAPYEYYTDEDIQNRVLYVEASRGCPFKCEFCLSALDKTAYPFELKPFIRHLDNLLSRGARQFKFVDRTFNLKISTCVAILDFFLREMTTKEIFLHFEVIPDRLPDALKEQISRFPAGSLQFEIGIQSFNPTVQAIIKRKQNIQRTLNNMQWLRDHSTAHIHADLIFGLPGETLQSFAEGFDQLVALQPDEIQLGILKRLKGSPITTKSAEYEMVYADNAPYQLLKNRDISFETMQTMVRFARYWDLIANSGRFRSTLPELLAEQPFERFMQLSSWFYQHTGQTHKIARNRLFEFIYCAATAHNLVDDGRLYHALQNDWHDNRPPRWLSQQLPPPMATELRPDAQPGRANPAGINPETPHSKAATPTRQKHHLAG